MDFSDVCIAKINDAIWYFSAHQCTTSYYVLWIGCIQSVDWTTGLADFHQKHTVRLSMGPEQHEARLWCSVWGPSNVDHEPGLSRLPRMTTLYQSTHSLRYDICRLRALLLYHLQCTLLSYVTAISLNFMPASDMLSMVSDKKNSHSLRMYRVDCWSLLSSLNLVCKN